jgi:hypothetical protein
MRHRSHVAVGSPTARIAAIAAATLLVATLCAGALVAGAQSPTPVPSEAPTAMGTAWVTGTLERIGQLHPHSRTVEGVEYWFTHHTDAPIEMSDPRLTGTLSSVHTAVEHPVVGDDSILVLTGEYRIENEGGSWEGTHVGLEGASDPERRVADTGVLVGSGGYEGLTAYLSFEYGTCPCSVTGAIFPADTYVMTYPDGSTRTFTGAPPPAVTFEELPEE